jgi:hypothetical protein
MLAANTEVAPPWIVVDPRAESHPSLIAALVLLTLGALLATAGFAKLYMAQNAAGYPALVLAAAGGCILLGSAAWALRLLQVLPESKHECVRYGRHMIGLTYLLLLLGLCNGVGTSILALEGGLGFSASQLVYASDPNRVVEADKKRQAAREDLLTKERAISDAKRRQLRAELSVAAACRAVPVAGEAEAASCIEARTALLKAQDDVIARNYEWDDAYAKAENAKQTCERTRTESQAALFFLLSVSTMMSLFGATFYVVNRVRSKRPLLTDDAEDASELANADARTDGPAARSEPAPAQPTAADASPPVTLSESMSVRVQGGADKSVVTMFSETTYSERFDVHAFWSGAFFRVGEAVLFTFAFFWLLWTSGDRTHVIWMPVLGLFVGMFVRTGEAVVFRLGERLLLATQSLLPSGDAPRQPPRRPEA